MDPTRLPPERGPHGREWENSQAAVQPELYLIEPHTIIIGWGTLLAAAQLLRLMVDVLRQNLLLVDSQPVSSSRVSSGKWRTCSYPDCETAADARQ